MSSSSNDIIDDQHPNRGGRGICLHSIRTTIPRTYHFIVYVVLPLLGLIGLCFGFGHLLAHFEMETELDNNDAMLAERYRTYVNSHLKERQHIYNVFQQTPKTCWIQENHHNNNTYDDTPYVDQCYQNTSQIQFPILSERHYFKELEDNSGGYVTLGELSFNWASCPRYEVPRELIGHDRGILMGKVTMRIQYQLNYKADLERIILEGIQNGDITTTYDQVVDHVEDFYLYDDSLLEYGLQRATGRQECQVHTAGGAIFWFTIMTTIGYGNTSPVTNAGQALVQTAGFVSIIAFTALIGLAESVVTTIVDCSLKRIPSLSFLAKSGSISSVGLWFSIFVGWLLIFAAMVNAWMQARYGEKLITFQESFWFSYITLTTVGFGDYYLPQEDIEPGDLFYLPLIVLLAFVSLGAFAAKLASFLVQVMPAAHTSDSLEEMLLPPEDDDHLSEGMEKKEPPFLPTSDDDHDERAQSLGKPEQARYTP